MRQKLGRKPSGMSTGARFIAGVRNSFGNVAANVTYVGVMRYVTVTKLDLDVSGSRQKDACVLHLQTITLSC